ncbi:MAG: PKD domain-containing protein [Clostridiales bacterium]|nr:PKD domain-containing protein [Clostridiales bacterium]
MHCKNCGKQILGDSKFCQDCGSKVIEPSVQNPTESANETKAPSKTSPIAPQKPIVAQNNKSPKPEVQENTTIISPPPLPDSQDTAPIIAPLPPKATVADNAPLPSQPKPTPTKASTPPTIETPPQAISNNTPLPSAPVQKKIKKHGFVRFLKVTFSILLTLPILAVLALFIISAVTSNVESKSKDSTIPSHINSTFDDSDDTAPMITDVTPMSATISTTITFAGENIDATKLINITINDQQLNVNEVTDSSIQAVITHGAQSGDIVLHFVDGQITIDEFEILPQQKTLILEEELSPSDSPQTIVAQDISIILPAGAIDSPQTLKISEIINPQTLNLPPAKDFRVFSITLGDISQFDDIVTIIIDLPEDTEGQPTAAYFNEETSLYNTLPSEVIDGKLHIFTSHLTDFAKIQWGTSHLSSDGYFRMHYFSTDTVTYTTSMDELAVLVGETLEQVRKDYEAKIPAAYRENFKSITINGNTYKDTLEVYIDSSLPNCKYNAITNNILLPTSFSSQEKFETVLAHEFFHVYQDSVWNELNFVGTMSKSENLWAVEVLAELAAYEIAFPGKNRHRPLDESITPSVPYDTFDSIQEYSMSCYLRYLLDITNSKAEDLWIHVAGSSNSHLEISINDFFKSKSSAFISLQDSYPEFWKAVLGDSNAPEHYNTFNVVEVRDILAYEHTAAFEYYSKYPATMKFYMLDVKAFPDNVPIRIFNMQSSNESGNPVWSTQISGVTSVNFLNSKRVPGGHNWYRSSIGDYKRYSFEKGKDDVVLFGFESTTQHQATENPYADVKFTEIKSKCFPESIEDAAVGVEQQFEITFSDVFENVSSALLIVDFGDGTTAEFPKDSVGDIITEIVTHVYEMKVDGVAKFMLYDTTRSEKELIAQLNVPVGVPNEITITASPNPTKITEEVSFSISEKNAGYTYNWSLGDGTTNNKLGLTELTHTYEKFGSLTVSVAVYDELDEHIGTAKLIMTVEEPSTLSGKWQFLGTTYTDFGITYRGVSTITFYAEGICVMSVGIQSTTTLSMEDTPCTYVFDGETSKGTIKFKNQETGANEAFAFTISGNSLFMVGIEYKKTQ